jgi:hypothetical protein
VSAAGSARLALVPPDAEVRPPPPPPVEVVMGPFFERRAVSARARRVLWGMWAAGCAALVGGSFLWPLAGDVALGSMALAGLFLLSPSGVALGCFALLDRTREAWTSLMAAGAVLAAAVALMAPARHAAVEMHVAANQAELEALAAEIRAAVAASPFDPDTYRGSYASVNQRLSPRLLRLSLAYAMPIDGGLLFRSSGERDYSLIYVDGVAGPPDECRSRRLRFLGGRWFEAECGDRSNI